MKINQGLVAAAVSLALLPSVVLAAQKSYLNGQPQLKNLLSTQSASVLSTPAAQLIGLDAEDGLVVFKEYKKPNGDTTVRYQQTHKGLPVLGDHVILTYNESGRLKYTHGAMVRGIAADVPSVTPGLSGQQIAAMMQSMHAKKHGAKNAPAMENQQRRLAIWLDGNKRAHLVYEVTYVTYGDQPSRPYKLIDATTGEVLFELDNLQTANATGPGGNLKTGRYDYGTDYGYLDVAQAGSTCTMQNTNVKTVNLNHGTSGTTAYSFTCPENTFKEINGAYAPLNDAHYFGNVVFNMYNAWVGVAPLTFQLQMRVHYSNNYENAFWDGSAMTFGDGASTFYPLVSLDVSAHEVSHGFTEQNSGLVYSGKSGGLNEAFSDMAGEAAEAYMLGSNDWLVGEQIFKSSGALRYMSNPPQDGSSIDNQADFTSSMDVHYSSGVFNKAFYLLSTTAGWDIQKAFKTMALANQQYWTSSTNWDQAGNGVMDAACDLGFNTADVKAALAAVGVTSNNSSGSPCGTPEVIEELQNGVTRTGISGASKDQMFFVMDVPAGASNLTFNTTGGTGDADLYVKFGSKPSLTDYGCKSTSSSSTESCAMSPVQTGKYYVMVEAWNQISNVSLTGSYSTGGGSGNTPIDRTESNISVAQGSWAHYTQDLTAGYNTLTVTITGGSGDADLYVTHGSQSTTSSYDCRPYKYGNEETCTFTIPASGTWYVDVRGYSAASGVTLNIQAN